MEGGEDLDSDEETELVMGAWESFDSIPKQIVPPALVSIMTDSLGFKAPTPIQVRSSSFADTSIRMSAIVCIIDNTMDCS